MDVTSPLNLVPELLLHIFLSFDSLRDVSHLAAASRTFREIFMTNANSIYSEVASRHTRLFNEAQTLLNTQDQKALSQGEEPPSSANEAAAIRMIRLGLNERILSKFSRSFAEDCLQFVPFVKSRRPATLTASEVLRFEHAYYGLWTLIESMSLTEEPLLATLTLREFVRLSDVLMWVCARFGKHDTKYQPFSLKKWQSLHEMAKDSVKKRNTAFIPMPEYSPDEPRMPSWIPWSVWDQYQEEFVDTLPNVL